MSREIYSKLQTDLQSLGLYTGKIDGMWGPMSINGFNEARALASHNYIPGFLRGYCGAAAWSAKVSDEFVDITRTICNKLGIRNSDWMMGCMAFETGRTFSPTIQNGAGAPYYGIIQFGAAAAKDAGTTIPALLKMTAEEQLTYVYNFFRPYAGKLNSISDCYLRILWPRAVGQPETYVLWDKDTRPTTYNQNKGLDTNKDGVITKAEAAGAVVRMLVEGLDPINMRPIS